MVEWGTVVIFIFREREFVIRAIGLQRCNIFIKEVFKLRFGKHCINDFKNRDCSKKCVKVK